MDDFVSSAQHSIRRLRTALTKGNETQVDREVLALEESLLDKQAYRHVWDEGFLAEVGYLFLQYYGEESRPEEMERLCHHLAMVRSVHDKLYAILNHNVDLDALLFLHLDAWPQLDKPVGCAFGAEIKGRLHKARSTGDTEERLRAFADLYFQHLADQGHADAIDRLRPSVQLAVQNYCDRNRWTAHGLFTVGDTGELFGLRIVPEAQGTGQIKCLNQIDAQMASAAKEAVACVRGLWSQTRAWDFTWSISRSDIDFSGNSIGLALTVGILAEVERFDIDAYTAFTGYVEWHTGDVKGIQQLNLKLRAAKQCGIRRVFVPQDNSDEIGDCEGLDVVPVGSVAEAREWLQTRSYEHANTPLERLANAKIRELEIDLESRNIHKVDSSQSNSFCKRVVFSDYREKTIVNVYHANSLKPVVQGRDCKLKGVVQETCDRVFGPKPRLTGKAASKAKSSPYVVRDPAAQDRIKAYILRRNDAIEESEQNCIYRAKVMRGHQAVFVRQFTNGTLTVSGHAPLFDEIDSAIQAILGASDAPLRTQGRRRLRSGAGVEAVKKIRLGEEWIGTDESGKGDYFGPLVGAAALVDERIARILEELGVRDSKKLSDKRVLILAAKIHQVCGKRVQVVPISPERYNQLYVQFRHERKNLNTLLAWAHTRAIENILAEFPHERITVIVDKFADEHYIQSKLLERGRKADLNLVQLPKAEANVAVAAASVLARAEFLRRLARLSTRYDIGLPKGASDPRIVEVARKMLARHGKAGLAKVAKLHFRTTQRVLGSNK